MNNHFKKYIIFWFSQSVSQLGSAMTSFALILWAYTVRDSALTVSLMSFCSYVPYVLVSLFAGTFVDRHSKKVIMLVSDSIAALCSVMILLCILCSHLRLWHIYLANGVIGFMNAFQSPASQVATGRLVPEDKLTNVSGMNSFSANLTSVLSPVLAAFLFSFGGLQLILAIDLLSFAAAFLVLLFLIFVPESKNRDEERQSVFAGCAGGYTFLIKNRGIFRIVVTMSLLNFFSRLTYENILSPMILARSGNSSFTLGVVNAAIGVGGIAGGMIVSAGKLSKNRIKMIYVSAALSFLFGDILMGTGRNTFMWSIAGIAASFPIPFIEAGQNAILYQCVPGTMQGRVFAVRNAVQYSTIPIGILLGGVLADYVFEPYMRLQNPLTSLLHLLVGEGAGSGMAVMFLCTGICGSLFSLISYRTKEIRELSAALHK